MADVAGQTGLIKALAGAFIDWSRDHGGVSEDYLVCMLLTTSQIVLMLNSLQIDWVKGDTTESIKFLATGDADLAITYNPAAESRAIDLKIATRSEYVFRDHFYLVGPRMWDIFLFFQFVHCLIGMSVKTQRALTRTTLFLTC